MSKRQLATSLNETHVEQEVVLKGWVQRRRDLGGLIFIHLRDKSGVIQVVFNPEHNAEALAIAEDVRSEYVIEVTGTIVKRDASTVNEALQTGTIEVHASAVTILNKSKTPPFIIESETDVS